MYYGDIAGLPRSETFFCLRGLPPTSETEINLCKIILSYLQDEPISKLFSLICRTSPLQNYSLLFSQSRTSPVQSPFQHTAQSPRQPVSICKIILSYLELGARRQLIQSIFSILICSEYLYKIATKKKKIMLSLWDWNQGMWPPKLICNTTKN